MQTILTTNHLNKQIGAETIVSDFNMHIAKGEIYGFLGPNGAGKTTVMKMITNQWKPTSGDIILFGEKLLPDSYSFLKRMGSMIEFPVFYEELTAEENLKLHCEYMGYYSPDSVEKALSLLSLSENRGKRVKEFSLGMKQRLGIARAVLTKPEFLVLDEPTNGLDPAGMKQFRDLFRMLCKEYGMTILISSHLLSEIESLAHTIGIIHKGRLVKEISMKEITEKGLEYLEIKTSEITKASFVFTERLNISNFKIFNNNLIRVYTKQAASREIMKALTENQVEIQGFHSQTESLEEYFLKVTGGDSECGN
ncbi:ABC transporter ATP-binding protein [Clostridium boliviensis]|uniref:ABC transporter ATP-binding protein n=1 Tax=Clostridium boliviensis TaxID=318465 RepID=A0ABU4GT55_9CLOT|nr:ABC transporter ATP-binding protein [Clostridium boliviensis]MDW2800829.1 ABC transporter ATP-binding protein [Clostridium boliviensis]